MRNYEELSRKLLWKYQGRFDLSQLGTRCLTATVPSYFYSAVKKKPLTCQLHLEEINDMKKKKKKKTLRIKLIISASENQNSSLYFVIAGYSYM